MGFLSRLSAAVQSLRDGNPLNNPAVPLGGPGFWAWLFAGDVTEAGEQINDFTALQQVTVYACVRVIAESLASLPLRLYERLEAGRREAVENDLYGLLRYEPNPEMSAFTFLEALTGSLCLSGNCYAQIVRNKLGRVAGLYPLHPHKTKPVRLADGNIAYETSDGSDLGKARLIPPEAMLHIPLFSFDGLCGLSPIQQAKQTIGLARAAEKYGARFFGSGSKPGGVLSPADGSVVDEKTISQVRESWQAMQAGINQGKTAVIPGNWKYSQLTLSPEESQFLETRRFVRTDICALFRVPPHMVGDTSRLSNSNHEQQSLQFVTDTLRPYVCRFEQEIERKLMPQTGRNAGKFFVEFDVRERLRGDFETTMKGYALGRQWGFMSANMILEDMGENPIGAKGDIYLAPVNMVNLENLEPGKQPAPGVGVNPAPAKEPDQGGEADSLRISRFLPAYIGMFRDAVGRLCKREKRDSAAVSAIFGPVLTSLASQLRDIYAVKFGISDRWNETEAVAAEALNGLLQRVSAWQTEKADQIAMQELRSVAVGMNTDTILRAAAARNLEF